MLYYVQFQVTKVVGVEVEHGLGRLLEASGPVGVGVIGHVHVEHHAPLVVRSGLGALLAAILAVVLVDDLLVAVLARTRHVHAVVLLGVDDDRLGAEVVRLVHGAHLLVLERVERLPVGRQVGAAAHAAATHRSAAARQVVDGRRLDALVEPALERVRLGYVRIALYDGVLRHAERAAVVVADLGRLEQQHGIVGRLERLGVVAPQRAVDAAVAVVHQLQVAFAHLATARLDHNRGRVARRAHHADHI